MAPAAIPTAKPIMKPILTRSKQLGWVWPYGPTATGIYRGLQQKKRLKTSWINYHLMYLFLFKNCKTDPLESLIHSVKSGLW